MNKFLIMGITVMTIFTTGLLVFLPNQQGKILPDTSSLTTSKQATLLPPVENSQQLDTGRIGQVETTGKTVETRKGNDGQLVITGDLPSELRQIDTEAKRVMLEFAEEKTAIDTVATTLPSHADTEKLIKQVEALIVQPNARQ